MIPLYTAGGVASICEACRVSLHITAFFLFQHLVYLYIAIQSDYLFLHLDAFA